MCEFAYMRLYPADLIADTTELSTKDFGAYMLLLVAMWRKGGRLPLKAESLARICRFGSMRYWHATWAELRGFFIVSEDGEWISQKRLTAELEHSREVSDARRETGKTGGEKRASNVIILSRSPVAKSLKNNNPTQAIATITSTTKEKEKEKEKERMGRGGRDEPSQQAEKPRDLGKGFESLSAILSRSLANPPAAATYSDAEIAILARRYPNVPDMRDRVQKLVAWAARQGIDRPNEIKRAVSRALEKRAEPQEAVA